MTGELKYALNRIAGAARASRADHATTQALAEMAKGVIEALQLQERRIAQLERRLQSENPENGSTQD